MSNGGLFFLDGRARRATPTKQDGPSPIDVPLRWDGVTPEHPSRRTLATDVAADLYRCSGESSVREFVRHYLRGETFKYLVALRLTQAAARRGGVAGGLVGSLGRLWLRRLRLSLGINIPWTTEVGPGLHIAHAGGIVVNGAVKIGRDCSMSHNVTIGEAQGGRRSGFPSLGDRVFVGPGAVILGAIRIGDDVAIGANSVVTSDVPDHFTVAGAPAQPISTVGSEQYVHRAISRLDPVEKP